MEWSPKDIQDFFWSLGPAAVGLFLIWFAQAKVMPNRALDDQRMRLAVFGAYAGCWATGIAALTAFVWIWIGPYVSNGRYIRGSLQDVPNSMSVSTVDTETADVFFLSERTGSRAPVRTFAFVVRDFDGNGARRILYLSFASENDAFVAGVDLSKIGNSALLSDVRLAFQQDSLPNGEARYLLTHASSKSVFPLKRRERAVGSIDAPNGTRFASNEPGQGWLAGLMAAHAQSAPPMSWTRESLVSGLESPSLKVRNVAIAELADRLFASPEHADLAEAIVTRKEESATIRGRWSVYESIKAAAEKARSAAPARNGIISPPIPPALPLSKKALARMFIDALSGTASANDAAKWLFRHSGDPRTADLLFREIEAEANPDTKACYAAFAANVFYNWAVDVFLAGKAEGQQWFVSDGDLKAIEGLYARVAALAPVVKVNDEAASQFVIAAYGLGLFYAELALLPPERLKGTAIKSADERDRWMARSKTLMAEVAGRLSAGSKVLELYRYPFHRDIASAIASSGVSAAALKPTAPQIVNPQIRDNICKVSPRT